MSKDKRLLALVEENEMLRREIALWREVEGATLPGWERTYNYGVELFCEDTTTWRRIEPSGSGRPRSVGWAAGLLADEDTDYDEGTCDSWHEAAEASLVAINKRLARGTT